MASIGEEHFVGKVAQKALIEKDGKVLLVFELGSKSWDLPGGRLHKDEDPSIGLAREVREELGIEILIKEPVFVDIFTGIDTHISPDGDRHYLVVFRCELATNDQFTLQKEELGGVQWISKEEIDSLPIHPTYKKFLQKYWGI